jgi:hypothetical protein
LTVGARRFLGVVAVVLALGFAGFGADHAAAAKCSDFPNQAAAQAAANTRDGDGDGVYCESLPCPCATAAGGGAGAPAPSTPPSSSRGGASPAGCTSPRAVQVVTFSSRKYPNIRAHVTKAIRAGWPRVLTINRVGADQRRDRLLQGMPTKAGHDRDEYPPAMARGLGTAVRGEGPRGWMASVQYVPSSENRSHGATMGAALRGWCNGVRFRFAFG